MDEQEAQKKAHFVRHLFGTSTTHLAFSVLLDDLLSRENDFAVNLGDPNGRGPLTHTDILQAVQLLKDNPSITKTKAIQDLSNSVDAANVRPGDEAIINLAVQSMIMVDCSAKHHHAADFSLGGYRPVSWHADETFFDFVNRSFPSRHDRSAERLRDALRNKSSMKAWKLQKRLGISFRGTDNLAEHLLFEPRDNCLYLFHHAGFLKAHLERFQHDTRALDRSLIESLKL